MFCNIFDLFLTIVLIYLLVPVHGIYGYLAIIAISEILNFTISLIQLYKVTKFKFDYISYVFIPLLLVFATKLLFDSIDNYIEYDTSFVIIKICIFIAIYVVLFISFNIIKFIRNKVHRNYLLSAFLIRKKEGNFFYQVPSLNNC